MFSDFCVFREHLSGFHYIGSEREVSANYAACVLAKKIYEFEINMSVSLDTNFAPAFDELCGTFYCESSTLI